MDDKLLIPHNVFAKPKPRRFYLQQYVTAEVEGSFDDWPKHLQEQVMEALNKKAKEVRLPLRLVGATCDIDYGEAMDGTQDKPYLFVIAEEMLDAKYSEANINLPPEGNA